MKDQAIFSRRHYIAIARVLRESQAYMSPGAAAHLRLAFGQLLGRDNYSFNYDKFTAEIDRETRETRATEV